MRDAPNEKPTTPNEEFLYVNLARLVDEDLNEADRRKADEVMGKDKDAILDRFRKEKGRLQLEFQNLNLSSKTRLKLRTFVEDESIMENTEAIDINRLERVFFLKRFRNRIIFFAALLVIGGAAYSYLKPDRSSEFKAIEYLHFEALAMEQSQESRLDLPIGDYEEVRRYLKEYKGLNFAPTLLASQPAGWDTVGASVIDYEVAKVAVVQFNRKNGDYQDNLFLFSFAGNADHLPKAEVGEFEGFKYRTYTTDDLNMIVWQPGDGRQALLVGRLSAPELAKIAKSQI